MKQLRHFGIKRDTRGRSRDIFETLTDKNESREYKEEAIENYLNPGRTQMALSAAHRNIPSCPVCNSKNTHIALVGGQKDPVVQCEDCESMTTVRR